MATAAVRHRSTGAQMRGVSAAQMRAAVRMGELDGAHIVVNFTSGRVSLSVETMDAAREIREIATELDASSVEIAFVHTDGDLNVDVDFRD